MKLIKNKFILEVICYLVFLYIRLVYTTSRWQISGDAELSKKLENKEPVIFAFWHGRLALLPNYLPYPEEANVIISKHGDGEFISKTVNHFGIGIIRGSTNRGANHKKGGKNRGGSSALRASINAINSGKSICVTPDGPRGPRMHVSSSITEIAKHTGAPVYPVTYSSGFSKIFKSWDRFMFPFPFGKAYIIFAEPITIDRGANKENLEKSRKEIENRLNTITHEADLLAGITPVKPAQ